MARSASVIGLKKGLNADQATRAVQARPRALPEGEGLDPGRRGAGLGLEQGRCSRRSSPTCAGSTTRWPSSSSTTAERRLMAAPTEQDLADAAARLGEDLLAAAGRPARAESSTGGLIGHAITMIPGASRYYAGRRDLPTRTSPRRSSSACRRICSAQHGAVSAEVAAAMADGVRAPLRHRAGARGDRHRRTRGRWVDASRSASTSSA